MLVNSKLSGETGEKGKPATLQSTAVTIVDNSAGKLNDLADKENVAAAVSADSDNKTRTAASNDNSLNSDASGGTTTTNDTVKSQQNSEIKKVIPISHPICSVICLEFYHEWSEFQAIFP
jgi:hypothetical protein